MNKAAINKLPSQINAISAKLFDMSVFEKESACDTVGCIIGHVMRHYPECIVMEDNKEHGINYHKTSEKIFGISSQGIEWDFLFSGSWGNTVKTNTKTQAIKRVKAFIANNYKVPNNFIQTINSDYCLKAHFLLY